MADLSLAQLRVNEGLSPEQLGEKIGVSGRTIRRVEAGAFPTPAVAKRIANYFGMQPSDVWPLGSTAA